MHLSRSQRLGRTAWLLGLAIVVVAGGCGRPRYTVRGKVVRDGGAAYTEQGFVVAEAVIDGKPVSGRGTIAADGTFTLSGRGEGDGVMSGTYRVRLVAPRGAGDIDSGGSTPLPFDKKFTSFETSGLTIEVGAGSNDYTITLEPAPGAVKKATPFASP